MPAKVISLAQLASKTYEFLENVPAEVSRSFGRLTKNFDAIIVGSSGNGKTNLIITLVKLLIQNGKVLYLSLEEGTEFTMQEAVLRQFDPTKHNGMIEFADFTMTYAELIKRLNRRNSAQFIVIDSIQYFDIDYPKYKALKEQFSDKSFIYISHADGNKPAGKTAPKVKYDVSLKIFVEGFVAFPTSRYGGNAPFIVYEQGAMDYWGDKYFDIVEKIKQKSLKKSSK